MYLQKYFEYLVTGLVIILGVGVIQASTILSSDVARV